MHVCARTFREKHLDHFCAPLAPRSSHAACSGPFSLMFSRSCIRRQDMENHPCTQSAHDEPHSQEAISHQPNWLALPTQNDANAAGRNEPSCGVVVPGGSRANPERHCWRRDYHFPGALTDDERDMQSPPSGAGAMSMLEYHGDLPFRDSLISTGGQM